MLESGFYNMDCMDGMAQFPDKFFELAIVDPPYGIGIDTIQDRCAGTYRKQNGGTWKKYHKTNWDSNTPDEFYFSELKRVSKNQIIWGGNFYKNEPTKCWVIWDKIQRDNRADGEMAWTSFDKPVKVFRYSRADAYINDCDIKIHPTQKPIALYKWLLSNYAKPGDKILDTHVGSASSLIACHQMGFEYWGFELDTDYYNAATERLNKAKAQVSMTELVEKPTIDQIKII